MSTVKANDITNVTGGIPTVKSQQLIPTAWVNFNGTSTVAIRDSENVSSITDNGTANYQVNFSTAMANANYACAGVTDNTGGTGTGAVFSNNSITSAFSTTAYKFRVGHHTSYYDVSTVAVVFLGGQA